MGGRKGYNKWTNEASCSIQVHPTIHCTGIHICNYNSRERMIMRKIQHGLFIKDSRETLPEGAFAGDSPGNDEPGIEPPASPGPGAGAGEYEPWFAAVGSSMSGGN